jgi:preprotein translocase subunit SecG
VKKYYFLLILISLFLLLLIAILFVNAKESDDYFKNEDIEERVESIGLK